MVLGAHGERGARNRREGFHASVPRVPKKRAAQQRRFALVKARCRRVAHKDHEDLRQRQRQVRCRLRCARPVGANAHCED